MDLPKQAKEQISKLDGPGGAAKVRDLFPWREGKGADQNIGRGACKDLGADEIHPPRNPRYALSICQLLVQILLTPFTRDRE